MQEIAFRGEQKFHGYKMEVSGFLDERAVVVSKHFRGLFLILVFYVKWEPHTKSGRQKRKAVCLFLMYFPYPKNFSSFELLFWIQDIKTWESLLHAVHLMKKHTIGEFSRDDMPRNKEYWAIVWSWKTTLKGNAICKIWCPTNGSALRLSTMTFLFVFSLACKC